MRYISTRGEAPVLSFDDALLAGLAVDGGLYVPEAWPELSPAEWRCLRGLDYPDLAAELLAPFAAPAFDRDSLRTLCRAAYARFVHPAVAPLVQLAPHRFVLELFHGPTLAFKDFALQLLGLLFERVLATRRQRITIVGATSGDTGSAAIEACRDRANLSIVILHPHGRVSEVQRRQMTTVASANVANLAVTGTFDDCQDLVKAMFADRAFRDEVHLSAVNSINIARVAAQIPYYAWAALALGAPDRPIAFAVPTGNFGNVFAAWAASCMGLPVARLIVGSNRNDILARFFFRNDMTIAPVEPSLSPSMDIQVSSNFERLLFELLGRDGARTAEAMRAFRATGRMPIPPSVWEEARRLFAGFALDDEGTVAEIARTRREAGYLADPHTAIGLAAARACAPDDRSIPVVVAATAHPAKFPEAVARAVGERPALPPHLLDLMTREERCEVVPNDLTLVQSRIRAHALRNAA